MGIFDGVCTIVWTIGLWGLSFYMEQSMIRLWAYFPFSDTSMWFAFVDPGGSEPEGYDEEGRWEEAAR